MITKEQAIDILEKFDFFQGQRAGRELWNDKPLDVQEQDIANFSINVALLKEYIADVAPKSEVEKLHEVIFKKEDLMQKIAKERNDYYDELQYAKQKVAREIFAEIGKILYRYDKVAERDKSEYGELIVGDIGFAIAELKKKYTGEQT